MRRRRRLFILSQPPAEEPEDEPAEGQGESNDDGS